MTRKVKEFGLSKGLFFLFFLSLALGQLGRISLPQEEIRLYLSDLILSVSVLSYLFYLWKNKKKLPRVSFLRPILAFFFWGLVSLILSLRLFKEGEVFIGGLYLLRWLAYALVYLLSFEVARAGDKKFIPRVLVLTGLAVVGLGFFQLWRWPDFSFMTPLGWDPHYYRLLSTFFDPNFCGGFLVLILSLLVSSYLFDRRWSLLFFSLVVYLALVLTYSRSAYLAFLLSMLVIGVLKEKKVFFVALAAFLLSFQLNPRVRTRVGGAVFIDASASHRLTSWEAALVVVKKHPIFGVGFNNYRHAQVKYGLVDPVNRGGHAGAGADSSFLSLWATTGVVGVMIYFWLGGKAVWQILPKAKNSSLALAFLAALAGLLFHGQFVNSWFFPVIMVYLWAILGTLEANG